MISEQTNNDGTDGWTFYDTVPSHPISLLSRGISVLKFLSSLRFDFFLLAIVNIFYLFKSQYMVKK